MDRRSFILSRWIFLRGLGAVFAVAFVSLWVQVEGLVGSGGIRPVARFLALARDADVGLLRLPTLCRIDASDAMLHGQCAAGVLLSLALVAGLAPRACLALLWLLYLSLTVAGQEFLSFQWDMLLLETAVFAFLWAPGGLRPGLARERRPSPAATFLLRWLLFRLVFASGATKLAYGDATWSGLEALRFHYQTQPLPTVPGWWAHQLPGWFQGVSCVLMFAIELVLPFLVFGPRRARLAAAAGLALLQLLIALTGNYGFFNLLSLVLLVPLLDDAWLARLVPRRHAARARLARMRDRKRVLNPLVLVPLLAVVLQSGFQLLDNLRLREPPGLVVSLERALSPFGILNDYGLFRVMTLERREIEIEGTLDGETWRPYAFRWKPGDPDRAPAWVQPHMPRLDWQMWFAALGRAREQRWFGPLMERLLAGSLQVLDLLAENPFPGEPPRQVRAILYEYRFTRPGERGAWWARRRIGIYAGPLSR